MYIYKSNFTVDEKNNCFIKEIARTGNYIDAAGKKVNLTREMFEDIVKNFKELKYKIPVPLGHAGIENPVMNTGWIKDLWLENESLFAKFEFTETSVLEKIKNNTIQDDSISIYKDKNHGWVLEHVALTLLPAIPDLSTFQPVELEKIESGKYMFEKFVKEKRKEMEKMEDNTVEIEKLKLEFKKANEDLKAEFEKKFAELNSEKEQLKMQLEKAHSEILEFQKKENTAIVEKYIAEKKISPAQKEFALSLLEKDRENFEKFVANNQVLSDISNEQKKDEIETITVAEFKKLKGKEYIEFAKKLQEGKVKII